MPAIEIAELTKSFPVKHKKEGFLGSMKSLLRPNYTEKTAVDAVTFSVEQGEMLAFLGPNGAGKSTMIKMLTGILHPSSGKADVLGLIPWKDRKRLAYKIGTVFGQKSQLWYHLPASDTFELISRIYELNRSDYSTRRDDLIERFDLAPVLNIPVRKLSLGERMRCEIACALLHRPQLVFLDEPTIGLDVVVKQRIRELIRDMNREEGTTFFLTSHDSGDVEQLCNRAIVINYGQVILDEQVSRLKREFLTHKTIELRLAEETGMALQWDGVRVLQQSPSMLKLSVDTSATSIEALLSDILRACKLSDVTIEDPPMEEIITQIYARS